MFNREYINRLKEQYPPGTRIELLSMEDPYAPVPPGTKGTIRKVDDAGNFLMLWDNGRTLNVVPEADSFRVLSPPMVTQENEVIKLYSPLSAIYYAPDPKSEYGCDSMAFELPADSLAGAEKEIRSAIENWMLPEEKERGLMQGYDDGLGLKVDSAFPSVQLNDETLWGVGVFHVNSKLSESEMETLKSWWKTKLLDVVQQDFSQVGISCAYGEIFVDFHNNNDNWNLYETPELASDTLQMGGQSL